MTKLDRAVYMIYWKAEIYLCPNFSAPPSFKISSFEKVDVGFISVLTEHGEVADISSSASDANTILTSYFGNELDTIYCSVFSIGVTNLASKYIITDTTFQVPSLEKNFPNSIGEYVSIAKSTPPYTNALPEKYRFLYIPSLKRIIALGGLYSVDGDIATKIANSLNFPISLESTGLNLSSYIGYKDGDDLTDVTRWTAISTYVRTDNNRCRIITNKFSASQESDLKLIFSSDSKPDGIGPISPDNPYEPGGPSGPGGGDGSFDNDSDQIVDSSLPIISSANTGFTRIYNPSLSQVQDLARYLWTDSSVIDTIWNHIKQFFENPMEAIIGFNLVPVPVPNGGTQNFALMYIDTGVSMTVAASQFVDVDCGTLELKEYYGSALDYSPNTKVSCFLPFIGTVSLNTDEVMGRTLQVKYRVDICSGSCVAKISVDGNFIYQYSGHCAINIPISAADFSSYVSSAISVAKLAGGALAAGAAGVVGVGAAEAVQQTNQIITTTQVTNTARNPATGRQITTGTTTRVETRESPIDQSSTQASFSGLAPQNIANTVGQIMTSKPSIEHSGSFSGNSGYLGVRRPFLIIERPNMCMPANFQALNGFPSMITLELSTCKGFTRVQQVQLTGLSATNPEQAEILQLLKSGVVM